MKHSTPTERGCQRYPDLQPLHPAPCNCLDCVTRSVLRAGVARGLRDAALSAAVEGRRLAEPPPVDGDLESAEALLRLAHDLLVRADQLEPK